MCLRVRISFISSWDEEVACAKDFQRSEKPRVGSI